MSSYLERLKKIDDDNFINIAYPLPTNPTKGAFDGFVGSYLAHIEKNNSEKEITNHWWLVHFKDAKTKQVCTWPFSNRSEILADYPQALEAEPLQSPIENSQAQAP